MKTQGNPQICSLEILTRFVLCTLACSAVAQDAAQDGGKAGLEVANVEGTLVAVGRDRIQFETEEEKELIAVLNQKSTVKYTGSAEHSFLQQGLFVRFVGSFDMQRGTMSEPLTELEIFRPVASRRMTPEQRQKQTPGIYPVQEKDKPGRADRRAKPPAGGPQQIRVVGRVGATDIGRIQVIAGNRAMIVELSPELEISVSAGDVTFCQSGDKVSVSGLRNAQQENWIAAETIEIEGAEPLSIEMPQPAKKDQRQERGKLGKDK